ncbi:uncharacterized protein LOC117112167, partial [Anneissia japonica]|uniref:uncharacterized protein LOC117112167 n=1 Tax=Anneissia japonica TaxID=1529436 RepID=UPI001425B7E2
CDGTFNGDTWDYSMGWCYHTGAQLFLGDFNGDGRTDLLCHDTTGYKWVALASTSGTFSSTSWEAGLGWCWHSGAQLFIDDFNADNRSDMLCHDGSGYKWISYANQDGSFPGTSWERAMGWCIHSGSQLFTGDFNGDRRADLLCHDSTGYKWVALASSSGTFTSTSWESALGWCYHNTAKLYIADFNKDKRADMLCSDGNGYKWVAFSTPAGAFTGTSWEKNMGWCTTGSQLLVADVNGDGGYDLLCHRPSDGYKWVALNAYQ